MKGLKGWKFFRGIHINEKIEIGVWTTLSRKNFSVNVFLIKLEIWFNFMKSDDEDDEYTRKRVEANAGGLL